MIRRLFPLIAVVLVLASCGGGSDLASDVTGSTDTTVGDRATASTIPTTTAPPSSTTIATTDPDATQVALRQLEGCTVSSKVEEGTDGADSACIEATLTALGHLDGTNVPDEVFDAAAVAALRTYQEETGLVADGVVGRLTATAMGVWEEPPIPEPDASGCAPTGHSAVVDRDHQRAWLCDDGEITHEMPMTSALTQPDPGTYDVYAKDMDAWSDYSGAPSTMTHFVAFTRGKYQGARIAFHSIPKYADGSFIQPLDAVGTAEWHGDSAGCIRVLPDDAQRVWDWLAVGDTVTVIS